MKRIIIILFLVNFFTLEAQMKHSTSSNDPEWVQYMYGENPNLFTLRALYDAYYEKHEFKKDRHTQYFKRLIKEEWLNLDQDGNILPKPERRESVFRPKSPTSAWEEIGPWDYDHEQAMAFKVQSPGAAHVYVVEQSPVNSDLIYAGTATAGLWKSTDKGLNWVSVTKFLDLNSVYSLALDPINSNIVYFGERNGQLWKSIDGGNSFSIIGQASFVSSDKWFRDIKIIGTNTLLVATDEGLFRSTDGGANFTNVHAGHHQEIEIKPNDPNILYTIKHIGAQTEFYKSTDNGINWVQKTNGWPSPASGDEQKRTEIAVSASSPDNVYIWTAGKVGNNGGLYGFYMSYDAGESFNFECCDGSPGGTPTLTNPNMLGYSETGEEEGGQYYYDLAFGASPTDASRIFGAGIMVWRSENMGTDWDLNAHWVTWVGGANTENRYVHADVHDIKFFEAGSNVDMWVASDGGLYYSSDQGDHFEPRMHGIHGTDFWGFGAGFKNGYVMLGGTYHNGTLIRYNDIYKGGLANPNEGGWLAELAGDNYRGFMNYGKPKIAYADNGSFEFSEDRTVRRDNKAFDGSKKCNTSYVTGEYGTYGFDPTCYNTFYSPVDDELYKTTDGGVSFELVHDFDYDKTIQVKVAWADPNVIYLTHKQSSGIYKIRKSTDGGSNWTDVTPSPIDAPGHFNKIKYIEVDDEDPNKIWCILMGNHSGSKVFESTDGGSNWTNITSPSIDNENVISISHHYGTEDGLYIGTTKAVYYRNDALGEWVLFNNNLPTSTMCSFIEPFYGEGKIRTATQRGVYECDFYENAPPVAMISANMRELNLASTCLADTVQFMDHSTVRSGSANWHWEFEGGLPATSNLENPKVVYTSPGTFDVKLIVSDAFGADTVEITDFITITNNYSAPYIAEDFSGNSFPPVGWKLEDSEGSSWEKDWPEDDVNQHVACYANYWIDATSQEHYLVLPGMDFSGAQNATFSFDYTYNDNGSYTDSLALVYRSASNTEWQVLWQKGGQDLTVQGTDPWFWYSSNVQINWENVTVDLTPLLGESCVELAFSNIGNDGNHIWIDNVNLVGSHASVADLSQISIAVKPNPSHGAYFVSSNTDIQSYTLTDLAGKVVFASNAQSGNILQLNISSQPNGIYFLKINTEQGAKTIRLAKQ